MIQASGVQRFAFCLDDVASPPWPGLTLQPAHIVVRAGRATLMMGPVRSIYGKQASFYTEEAGGSKEDTESKDFGASRRASNQAPREAPCCPALLRVKNLACLIADDARSHAGGVVNPALRMNPG